MELPAPIVTSEGRITTSPLKGAASSAAVAEPQERSLLAETSAHQLKTLNARSAVVSSYGYKRSGVARDVQWTCLSMKKNLQSPEGMKDNTVATRSLSWMLLRK